MGCGVTLKLLILTSTVYLSHGKAVERKQDVAYIADPVGNPLPRPASVPSKVGSPASLARPDRYEFYTFDETGELIKNLLTLEEIQEIIASGGVDDGHLLAVAQADLTKPSPSITVQRPSQVHTVVNNVQNVLKAEMEAQKRNPPKPTLFDTPDVSSSWSMILPAIFGNTGGSITPDTLTPAHGEPETDVINIKKENEDDSLPTKESTDEILTEEEIPHIDDQITDYKDYNIETDLIEKIKEKPIKENKPSTTIKPIKEYLSIETKTTDNDSLDLSSELTTSYVSSTTEKAHEKITVPPTKPNIKIAPTINHITTKPVKYVTIAQSTLAASTPTPFTKSPTVVSNKKNDTNAVKLKTTTKEQSIKLTTPSKIDANLINEKTTPPTIKVTNSNTTPVRRRVTTTRPSLNINEEIKHTANKVDKISIENNIKVENHKDVPKKNISTSEHINLSTTERYTTTAQSNNVDITSTNEIPPLDINKIISQIAVDLQDEADSTQTYSSQRFTYTTTEIPSTTVKLVPLKEDKIVTFSQITHSKTEEPIVTTKAAPTTVKLTTTQNIITTEKSVPSTTEEFTFIKILPVVRNVSNVQQKNKDVPETKEPEIKEKHGDHEESYSIEVQDDADYLDMPTTTDNYVEVTKPSFGELSDSITDLISQIVDNSGPTIIPMEESLKTTKVVSAVNKKDNLSSLNPTERNEVLKDTEKTTESVIKLIDSTTRKAELTSKIPESTTIVQDPSTKLIPTITVSHVKRSTTSKPFTTLKEEITTEKTTVKIPNVTPLIIKNNQHTESEKLTSQDIIPTTYRPITTFIKNRFSTTTVKNLIESKEKEKKPSTEIYIEVKNNTKEISNEVTTSKLISTTHKITTEPTTTTVVSKISDDIDEEDDFEYTTETSQSEYSTVTEYGITQDDELMQMLSEVSKLYQPNSMLESKTEEIDEPQLTNQKKVTLYKTSDVLGENPKKEESIIENNTENLIDGDEITTEEAESLLKETLHSSTEKNAADDNKTDSNEKKNEILEASSTTIKSIISERSTEHTSRVTLKPIKKIDHPKSELKTNKDESKEEENTTNKIQSNIIKSDIKNVVAQDKKPLANQTTSIHFVKIETPSKITTAKNVTNVNSGVVIKNNSNIPSSDESEEVKITPKPTEKNIAEITTKSSVNTTPTKEKITKIVEVQELSTSTETIKPVEKIQKIKEEILEKSAIDDLEGSTDPSIKSSTNILPLVPQTKVADGTTPSSDIYKLMIKNEFDKIKQDKWQLVSTVASRENKTQQTTSTTTIPPKKTYQNSKPIPERIITISQPQFTNQNLNVNYSSQDLGLEKTTASLGEDVYQFSQLCNELAFSYWKSVTSNGADPKRSLVVSPFAVTSLLAMMFLGARGATSGEMNDILKLDDMVTFNPHIVFKNVTESIEVSPKAGVATSAFVRELYSDKSKGRIIGFYKDRVQQFYSGHVEEVNFNTVGDIVRRRTNLLVKRQTSGKIPEYIKGNNMVMRPPLSVFAANIFQTDCSGASTDGRDGEMYFVVSPSIRQRRLVPVPAVLYKRGFLAGYVPELDATVASIGGTNQIISTILVMPGQQGSTAQGDHILDLQERLVETAIKDSTWSKLLRSLIPRQGLELQIPRFSHRSVENGTMTLKKMGLRDLFNSDKADLRGINGIANDLFLSDMMLVNTFTTCGEGLIGEQHHVEVYPGEPNKAQRRLWRTQRPVIQENFEPPVMNDWEEPRDYQRAFHDPLHDSSFLSMPLHLRPRQARLPDPQEQPRLKFDKPFMFFVRHNPTGLILYMGRYNPRLLP